MATYVLVHGSNQGGWIWQPLADRLRAAGHRVYAPSLDGCGERKGQMRPGITTETQAGEIAQLLFYEDLKDVVLVGTSYGGMAAWRHGSSSEAKPQCRYAAMPLCSVPHSPMTLIITRFFRCPSHSP